MTKKRRHAAKNQSFPVRLLIKSGLCRNPKTAAGITIGLSLIALVASAFLYSGTVVRAKGSQKDLMNQYASIDQRVYRAEDLTQ